MGFIFFWDCIVLTTYLFIIKILYLFIGSREGGDPIVWWIGVWDEIGVGVVSSFQLQSVMVLMEVYGNLHNLVIIISN
jgi:hypothetical protein